MRFGALSSPVDQLDRCTMVGCHGDTYFLVARTFGRQWIVLASRPYLLEAIERGAPTANAQSLNLLDRSAEAVV